MMAKGIRFQKSSRVWKKEGKIFQGLEDFWRDFPAYGRQKRKSFANRSPLVASDLGAAPFEEEIKKVSNE